MTNIKFVVLLLLSPYTLFSQKISGRIVNIQGEKIISANIVIKDSLGSEKIKEFVVAQNGRYLISLKNVYSKVIIEVSANKYVKDIFVIKNPVKESSYTHDFILQKDESLELKEVIVMAKALPFLIKEDTVKYNVSGYRDGSERKIEDIIKKLPGIQVNEKTGEILYKGKSVETVKLDGDDLFGSNYSIGTKNINVDMIEQVQAIENYSDNPLLKGIESGDKVALNLTLKKHKLDFSGNVDVSGGLSETEKIVLNDAVNILGVSKKYKSFGTLSYNNIGINNSPFDYFSSNPSIEQIKEADFLAKKNISESFYANYLDDKRTNINNSLFACYNSIFKLSKSSSIKTNLYYVNDKIESIQTYQNRNNINNQQILTSDIYGYEKKPQQYRGDLEFKSNLTQKSILEYDFKISQEKINTLTNILQNGNKTIQAELATTDFNYKQSLLFTKRLSGSNALQVLVNQSSNNLPQNYLLSPSVYDSLAYGSNNQFSNFRKDIVSLQSILLGRINKNKYTFTLGSLFESNLFQSGLGIIKNDNYSPVVAFTNDFVYKKYSFYNKGNYEFNLGNWKISPSYSLSYLGQQLINNIQNIDKRNFIFEPSLSVRYKFNSFSGLIGKISYGQRPFSEERFFDKPVYISNRTTVKNVTNLEIQKITSYGIIYAINNLFEQFRFNLGVNYFKNEGNYFPNIFIDRNITQMEYFYLPNSNEGTNFNLLIEKYIPIIESTIRLKSNYSTSTYKNIVNNSELRNNNIQIISTELFIKTAFDIKINFEDTFILGNNIAENTGVGKNFYNSINNTFKVIIKPSKKWFFITTSEYYLPNATNTKQNFLFIDATLRYTPPQKKYDMSFIGKNIINNSSFTQTNISDYSLNYFQMNLIPRYFMLNLTYTF
jgi:hypothetical protein